MKIQKVRYQLAESIDNGAMEKYIDQLKRVKLPGLKTDKDKLAFCAGVYLNDPRYEGFQVQLKPYDWSI